MLDIQLYKAEEYDLHLGFPQNWNELSFPELLIIAESFFSDGGLSFEELYIQILQERIKAKYPKVDADRVVVLLNIEDMAREYRDMMAFLEDANTLTVNPFHIPGFKMPEDHFNSILVGEYEIADQALSTWLTERNPQQLTEFFRAFYNTKIEVPENHMKVAALFFLGCKNELPLLFPALFEGETNGRDQGSPDPMAVTRMIHENAGPANGTRQDIRRTLLKEFLYDLQLKAERE